MTPLDSLFTGPWYLWFLGGMLSVQAWQWIKCKWRDYRDPEGRPHTMKKLNWFYVWTAIVLVVIVGVAVQGNRTYSFAEELAHDTRDCQIQFNKALKANTELTRQNDDWSHVQRTALASWLHDLLFPPMPYAEMDPNDPGRQDWALARTQQAEKIIWEAQQQQEKNLQEREPYPEPTCGK